ncbi:MAG: putative NRPS-like protein biosynthetic cluster [Candelaria pacifica]|nr:MAG: putative NRPS-like protein biosynthetic cluster [Candelaria pacifica]
MAHLTKEHVQELYDTFGELKVLDDIIQYRAVDEPPAPILGYPKSEDTVNEYENFTGKELDHFVDGAVKYFLELGLKPNAREVVGILAPSNVDFVVTLFALSRLGYTVLTLSLRIPPVAIVNLLEQTNCNIIAADTITAVSKERSLQKIVLPTRAQYGKVRPSNESPFVRQFDRETETDEIAVIMHSSGSTGLPKSVSLSHRNILTHPVQGAGMNNFGALPLYHIYGLSTTLQAIYMRKVANLFSASLPMTADNLMSALEATQPEIFHAVPYALGLLIEHERAMAYLKTAKMVTAAGARTPDELGERLIQENVNFGVVFGCTEAGQLGDTMRRKKGDDTWDYVRIYSNVRDSIQFEPIGNGLFEAVYLQSHPGLAPSIANSDDPAPGSWRSKDVFAPHPSIPDVWKYITRIDDRITLETGEKVLPLPIEGRIRQDDLVREAVVVGVDRAIPGVLIFKASDHLSTEDFLDAVWPSIEDANSHAESFSQITKDMVALLPSNVEYPKTDKGSIIRAQVNEKFADYIDEMYHRLEGDQEGDLQLDLAGIESFLKDTYKDVAGTTLESLDTDLFNAGVDSLIAIQMRRIIQKTLDLSGKQLSSNIIYEHGNLATLAKYLFSLSPGGHDLNGNEDKTQVMKELIQKYSSFGETVVLTGATGSLGAHILAQMVNSHSTKKVYCLVRGDNPLDRVLQSLKERGTLLEPSSEHKIEALSTDFSQPDLGLTEKMMEELKAEVSLIIHLAWPVNFSIHLQSFEPHLAGLRTLLKLSLNVYRSEPARLFFASSISTAENTPSPALIANEPIDDFSHVLDMGYAQSKLVGEHMVLNAARNGARSYVLRIGQIVGDLQSGFWNDNEYVPSMIRSALIMKALPSLDETCSWIPVDTLATAILEISKTLRSAPKPCAIDSTNPPVVYNMCNPHLFSWDQLLEEVRDAGLEFEKVPYGDWMQLLRNSAAKGDEEQNPAVKLLDHFELRYNLSHSTRDENTGVNGGKLNGASLKESSINGTTNNDSFDNTNPKNNKINGFNPKDSKINGGIAITPLKVNDAPPNANKTNGITHSDNTSLNSANDTEPENLGITFDTRAVLRDSSVLRQPPNIIEDGYVQKFMKNWLERWVGVEDR